MSEDSLTHLPDYFNRIAVLKDLKYIDEGDNNTVCMKGRVACEMGSHELMITELVFHNLGWRDLTLLCLHICNVLRFQKYFMGILSSINFQFTNLTVPLHN